MYVVTTVTFTGDDSEYEVGAEVEHEPNGPFHGYTVDEPDVSAANCPLKLSRILDQSILPKGWSDQAADALIEAYDSAMCDAEESAADYAYDHMIDDADDRDTDTYWSDDE
jgi:hypothetical protein